MEKYGEQRPYKKLSEEIILALNNPVETDISNSFRRYLMERGDKNQELVDRIIDCKNLRYSKKETGSIMLRNLDPKEVAKNCQLFFANAYTEISTVFND